MPQTSNPPLKQIPLHSLHAELGARFGPFAGYDMPLFYPAGVLGEHLHTREQAGLFDISHMLHVDVAGPQAHALVARLCPFAAASQAIGQGRYTFFLNDGAGIIDDLIVTRLGEQRWRIVCNAGCASKDLAHIEANAAGLDVSVTPHALVFLALQGPAAGVVLAPLVDVVPGLAFMQARETARGWFVSRSGYTGEDGFEIALPAEDGETLARKLLADDRVLPVGLAARDSLRLEAGLPLYGQDLAEDITPMEAGLVWAIPKELRQGGEFIGADALAAWIAQGRRRKRAGLKPSGASAPVRAHAPLFDGTGNRIGEVTSGGFGPTCGHPVAFGLVDAGAVEPLYAEVRGKRIEMAVTPLPFVPHRYKR
ncbi:MAG: glycine cleavage system aminomethyltransferase GcvT [Pseudomonadota bacterium]|nr:glycine cleavage system aminomethyltransferase GcvT [Pseudomonadota bacterium]